jgi:hypothetical protein
MAGTTRPAKASQTPAKRIDTSSYTLQVSDVAAAAFTPSQLAAIAEVASQAAVTVCYSMTADIAAKMIRTSLEATLGDLVPKLAAKADIIHLRDQIEQNRSSGADLTRAVGEAVRVAIDNIVAVEDVGEYRLNFVRDTFGRVVGAEKTRR